MIHKRKLSTVSTNYLGWSIVKYFSKDTTEMLQIFSFQIDKLLHGVEENITRKQKCTISINNQLNLALTYEYIKQNVKEETKKDIQIMIENIKSVLITKIKTLDWMDKETKQKALEKANFISYLIAYPDYYKNISFINEFYKDLEVSENHVKNLILWNNFNRKKEFLQLKATPQYHKWHNSVTDVNAFYNVLQNSVIIPSGLLQYPFYDVKRLKFLNYGAIGTLIGHELSHAFDNTGRQADKNGNIKEWWSEKSLEKYSKNLQCFKEHYDKYIVEILQNPTTLNKSIQMQINGFKTQDENIADILGLQLAYEALQLSKQNDFDLKLPNLEYYTANQLFFISFANQWCEISSSEHLLTQIIDGDHTPNKIRVLGALSNNAEFSKAFNCPAYSQMNSNKKCNL